MNLQIGMFSAKSLQLVRLVLGYAISSEQSRYQGAQ